MTLDLLSLGYKWVWLSDNNNDIQMVTITINIIYKILEQEGKAISRGDVMDQPEYFDYVSS